MRDSAAVELINLLAFLMFLRMRGWGFGYRPFAAGNFPNAWPWAW